jgi:hypothetical protein
MSSRLKQPEPGKAKLADNELIGKSGEKHAFSTIVEDRHGKKIFAVQKSEKTVGREEVAALHKKIDDVGLPGIMVAPSFTLDARKEAFAAQIRLLTPAEYYGSFLAYEGHEGS